MLMVDQRNHGASSALPFHPPHSIEASAEDIADLIATKLGGRAPEALLGHSLGGKTVLQFLKQAAASGSDLPAQACSSANLGNHTPVVQLHDSGPRRCPCNWRPGVGAGCARGPHRWQGWAAQRHRQGHQRDPEHPFASAQLHPCRTIHALAGHH